MEVKENKLNVYLFYESLGKILSERENVKITFTVEPKQQKNA